MDRVNRFTKVSRSEVVTKSFDSFSFSTLHITSIAICICADESHDSSLAGFRPAFPPPRLPGPVVGGFSAAFASTEDNAHCSRKAYSSKRSLCSDRASGSSASRSLCAISASEARPETTRSRILLSAFGGRTGVSLGVQQLEPGQMVCVSIPSHSLQEKLQGIKERVSCEI